MSFVHYRWIRKLSIACVLGLFLTSCVGLYYWFNRSYKHADFKSSLESNKYMEVRASLTKWKDLNPNANCETDYNRLENIYRRGDQGEDFLHQPPTDHLYNFEKFYLADPPVEDISQVATAKMSEVHLLNDSLLFQVDQIVTFRIDLKDGNRRPRIKGGDEVRAWLVDGKFKVTGQVKDLHNGSYLVSLPLPWTGKPSLQVGIVYNREYLRAMTHAQRTKKGLTYFIGGYQSSKGCEATPCSHLPLIPGYRHTELCNLTEENGAPWFCGRPMRYGLTCDHFLLSRHMSFKENILPLTNAEMSLFMASSRPPRVHLIPHKLDLTVKEGQPEHEVQQLPYCHKVPARETWRHDITKGYFTLEGWRSSVCQTANLGFCFKNMTVIFLGDSNARGNYYGIVGKTRCTHELKALQEVWHKPLRCVHQDNNFTIRWEPHSLPFMSESKKYSKHSDLSPSSHIIDSLPSRGRIIVVLHHYIHFTSAHFSSLHGYTKSVAAALRRLVQRNPEVTIVLEGPHTVLVGWDVHYLLGDFFRHQIEEMHKDVFRDLQDRIVYIHTSDFTIASESEGIHPNVRDDISKTILSYICGR